MTALGKKRLLQAGLAALVFFLLLVQPNHPEALTLGALAVFPLELPVILLLLLAVGRTVLSGPVRLGLTLILTLMFLQKMADFVSFNALSRGFNPVADLALIDAFIRLLSGALGSVLAGLVVLAAIVATGLVAALIWWASGVWARLAPRPMLAALAGVAATLPAAVAVAEIGDAMGRWEPPFPLPGAAFTARVGVERVELIRATLDELQEFRAAAEQDPFIETPGLFAAIDRDVIVIFVESYGRTSFDTPLYADLHRATLARYGEALSDRGLSIQSGFLASPTQGGQSWLAHATFSGGLWVNNQISYAAALSSGRATLFHHAADSGFRTAVVMPQITLDWPEADRMGFEEVLVSGDLGYNGLPFNWVTMPDQFSLAAMDRLLRGGDDPRLLFAQIALVSSHAPWVPVPDILPWDQIGDGQIYNDMATSGDPPEVVWRDRDRVRAQYRLAVDYSLQAVFEYALLHADDPPLLIVIGDHQAAEFVALDDRPDVPIHVIGPEPLVAALSAIAPDQGLLPADDSPVTRMDLLRDIILSAYAVTPEPQVSN